MHTNPIIASFCSLLYYPELSDHIKRFLIESRNVGNYLELPEFIGKTKREKKIFGFFSEVNKTFIVKRTKVYNVNIVNRWHVFVMLNKYKALIMFRKHGTLEKNESVILMH